MADKNNKVIHYKNRWHGSVIGFLFLFIFIYLAVQLYFFFTKEKSYGIIQVVFENQSS